MKEEPMTILVLGVGGNVGQGILKSLANSNLNCRVIGACISPSAFGLFTTDTSYLSPPAQSPEFLDWLLDVCSRESVKAVLSGVEPVLEALQQHKAFVQDQTGAVCMLNNSEATAVGADKLLTCEWLRDNGFRYPRFCDSQDSAGLARLIDNCGFPLIIKPRRGKGSKGVAIVRDESELANALHPGLVIQELLGDENSEFTAACLTDSSDRVAGVVAFHRLLSAGTTSFARAGRFPEVRQVTADIAEKLKPRGPCNMQMRMHKGHPVCFELNVRFSGTSSIRSSLGFNDVAYAIRHYVLGEDIDLPEVVSGQAIRYWNEAYISDDAMQSLKLDSKLLNPHDFTVRIEDYGARE